MIAQQKIEDQIMKVLNTVLDPEVPVLSVVDLGIVRRVKYINDFITVEICPTYSGCPALDVISLEIKLALDRAGFENSEVKYVMDEPWTTDWITDEGRRKLKEYGIAPPVGSPNKSAVNQEDKIIACPNCESENTEMISAFGSTACKSLYRCKSCLEPFDYFKCH